MTPEQTTAAAAEVNALQFGRTFPAKFAGVCALTGREFPVWAQVRYLSSGALVLNEAFDLVAARWEAFGPFDATEAQAWLDRGFVVHVYGKRGPGIRWEPRRNATDAQFRARTRAAVWYCVERPLRRA